MQNIFEDKLDLENIVCHSGGAVGSDSYFEKMNSIYGVKTNAYSFKTDHHKSENKVEISINDFNEGILEVKKANKILCRGNINKYINLLARNWAQVKYSSQTIAIGKILEPNTFSDDGFFIKSKIQVVSGGTGYAVAMSINNLREIYVFDQYKNIWFKWNYSKMCFIKIEYVPSIMYNNFAGIGTRLLNSNGIKAIEDVYFKTFGEKLI